jgi:hypothetical protein
MKYTYSSKELSGAEESPKGGQLRPVRKSSGSRSVWIVVFAVVGLCAAGGWWLSGRSKKPLSALPVAGQADKPALSDGAAQRKASDKDIVLYLESTEAEARQLFELVRQSAFVQENAQYRSLMKEVGFVYASTNDDVNAVASRMVGKDGKETVIEADSVILSVGYNPAPIATKGVHVIGDAKSVGNLRTVIWGAWQVAMKI